MGGRRTPGRCAAALALCAPLVAAPAAHAGGGSTIAGAPVAAPGISYTGIARAGERYWRVDLGVGNGLDVSGVVNDPHGASVCVLSPLATDATPATPLACQAPAPDATTFSFHFSYVSTRDGRYTLDFGQSHAYQFSVSGGHPGAPGPPPGGPTIAAAPAVAPSTLQFGDPQDGEHDWRIPLQPGQHVVIDVSKLQPLGPPPDPASPGTLGACLLSPLSSDVLRTAPLTCGAGLEPVQGTARIEYTATRTGSYTLELAGDREYSFQYTLIPAVGSVGQVAGASTIAAAPTIAPGEIYFADAVDGERYWLVDLQARTTLKLVWTSELAAGTASLNLYAPGARDGALTARVLSNPAAGATTQAVSYTSTQAGTYVLEFDPAAVYHFQATTTAAPPEATRVVAHVPAVAHRLRVHLSARVRTGSDSVPSGQCVLQRLGHGWHGVRRASTHGGTCSFSLRFARAGVTHLRITFVPADAHRFAGSASRSVRVAVRRS